MPSKKPSKKDAATKKPSKPEAVRRAGPPGGGGSDPKVEARIGFGDGGGILIDFKVERDPKGPSPTTLKAWTASYSGPAPTGPPNPLPNALACVKTCALNYTNDTAWATAFREKAPLNTFVWVFAQLSGDGDPILYFSAEFEPMLCPDEPGSTKLRHTALHALA